MGRWGDADRCLHPSPYPRHPLIPANSLLLFLLNAKMPLGFAMHTARSHWPPAWDTTLSHAALRRLRRDYALTSEYFTSHRYVLYSPMKKGSSGAMISR